MKTSTEIGKLAEALSKAQGEFKPFGKDKTATVRHKDGGGQHSYNYTDLATVIESTKNVMAKYGLSITQAPCFEGSTFILVARLMHSSGQWVEAQYPLPDGVKAQDIGSAITYGRRYTLCALLGISAEEDEDGAAASKAGPSGKTRKKKDPPADATSARCTVLGVDETAGEKDGKPWTRYDITLLSDKGQIVAKTFSDTIGGTAQGLSGRDAYAKASVSKDSYGWKLEALEVEQEGGGE